MALSVLDAGVLIGFLDADDSHHLGATAWLREAANRNDRLVVPASALAEILVGPSRKATPAVHLVEDLLDRVPIDVEPISREGAVVAARLRAKHSALRLPDALVIATAATLSAEILVTTDRRWPSRARLGLRASIVHP